MKYYIVTPEYSEPSTYNHPGWTGSDVVQVDAENARQAKILGVRALRQIGSHWLQDQRSDGRSPFSGLKAYREEATIDSELAWDIGQEEGP